MGRVLAGADDEPRREGASGNDERSVHVWYAVRP
jgi:hypothetical protein